MILKKSDLLLNNGVNEGPAWGYKKANSRYSKSVIHQIKSPWYPFKYRFPLPTYGIETVPAGGTHKGDFFYDNQVG